MPASVALLVGVGMQTLLVEAVYQKERTSTSTGKRWEDIAKFRDDTSAAGRL
jgi:hypothetical protein